MITSTECRHVCRVIEDMGSGVCVAAIFQTDATEDPDPTGNFAYSTGYDISTGYTCNFFFQRNVNNTGWYKVCSFAEPSGGAASMVEEVLGASGSVVVGRAMHDHVHGWGEDPPFKIPVFVVTHRPHPVHIAGATTFTFVAGVETTIAEAKAAAGGENVYIGGGASIADQALRLSLVDELNLHIEPVLLGGGTRLFADLGSGPIRLQRTRLIEGGSTTHVRFRVLRDQSRHFHQAI